MVGVGSSLRGETGLPYQLMEEIGSGGEGNVYRTDQPNIAVKIYKMPTPDIERKIRYMVSCPIDSYARDAAHTPIIAWPKDVLFKDGNFVGYAMPLVSDTIPIFTLCRAEEEVKSFFKRYSWLTHLGVAYNLATTVKYLHKMDCIVGDMNSKNIVVHKNGFITFLDVDSFDLTNPITGEHFPCTVGRPEFLPPELQGRNLTRANFTKHSDEFSLAVHVFRLLLHNRHPFDVKVLTTSGESRNESKQDYNISMGNCAYVRTVPGCEVPPNEPTLNMLPEELQEDFRKTFNYDSSNVMDRIEQRTSAEKWATDLGDLYKNRDTLLEQCKQNPEHYFLKERNVCEFCRTINASPYTPHHGSASNTRKSAPGQQNISQNPPPSSSSSSFSINIPSAPAPSIPASSTKDKAALRKKNRRIMFWTVVCLWALSLGILYLNMNQKNERLDRWNLSLLDEIAQLENKANFLDDYIRLISDSDEGDNYYHRYGCSNLDLSDGFYVYGVTGVKKKADPCPKCCGDD